MIRRICRECGCEMIKEHTQDGTRFFCKSCDGYSRYDEFDMDPYCPECGEKLQFCAKCGQGYFCNKCNGLVSSKKIDWRKN
jgi:hypothetical protein